MNSKTFQQALKVFFALALVVGLLVPVYPTSALPQKAAPAAVITPVNPNDTKYADGSQWNLNGTWGINAPMAWGITTGNAGTVVAVLDTGITTHEDLTSSRIINNPGGYDFVSDVAGDATDQGDYTGCSNVAWRGTHVAGIIGAASANGLGVAGINWNAKIVPIRVSGNCGVTTAADVVDGMRWAAGLSVTGVTTTNLNPAKVIHVSASVAGQACTTAYQADIDAITATGAVIVAAAGDTAANAVGFPANCNGVITVAATDALGKRADYSNYGTAVEISAPGGGNGQGDVLSTSDTGTTDPLADAYLGKYGTAIAAAHVSGVVSLMFAANPLITPAQVSAILQKTVQAFPSGGSEACTTSTCGWGIVDAGEAVRVANMPDLVITNATLTDFGGVPFNTPFLGQEFQVNVTVKNQGGLNLGDLNANSVTLRQVYVDRDPSSIARDAQGCVGRPNGEDDLGEFIRFEDNSAISSGSEATLSVKINNLLDIVPANRNPWPDPLFSGYYDGSNVPALPWGDGTHRLYVYADANCGVDESFEDNNAYSTYLTVNPFTEGALLYPRHNQNIGTDYNPTYKWNKVTGATHYRLYLSGPSGKLVDQWFEASSVCDIVLPTCSVELGPSLILGNAAYSWYMQSYSPSGGTGPWSNNGQPTNFSTLIPTIPVAVDLRDGLTIPANGQNIGTNYNPTLTWKKVDTVTWYRLYVSGPVSVALDKWYETSSICNTTTCSVTSPTLGGGNHTWYVQSYNSAGLGPWSLATNFSTAILGLPAAVDLRDGLTVPAHNAVLGTNYNPTFTWKKVNTVTWYQIFVSGSGGVVLNQWYEASSICNVTTCSVASPTLGGGNHTWYVVTYNSAGLGPSSLATNFSTTVLALPETVDLRDGLTVPAHNAVLGANYNPTFTWKKVDTATWYQLYVAGPGGVVLNQWYEASIICNATTCSVASPTLGGGNHTWYVLTYNSMGVGTWSLATNFITTLQSVPAAVDLRDVLTVPAQDEALGANYNPTFKWKKVDMATYYRLYISGPGGLALDQWYQASIICDGTTCSVASPTLKGGNYTWYVVTYNSAGYGPWSLATNFSTSTNLPEAAILLDPVNGQNIGKEYNPIYRWSKVDGVTYYRLFVGGSSGTVLDQWYKAVDVCDPTSCSTVSPTLAGGAYVWYVQTYGPGGLGPWSNSGLPTNFNADIPATPRAATNLTPTGTTTSHTPTYTWAKVSMATWYHLYIKGPNGVALDQWYQGINVCVGDTCSVVSPSLATGDHTWWVQGWNVAGYGPWKSATFRVSP